jgi:hypothetical protein
VDAAIAVEGGGFGGCLSGGCLRAHSAEGKGDREGNDELGVLDFSTASERLGIRWRWGPATRVALSTRRMRRVCSPGRTRAFSLAKRIGTSTSIYIYATNKRANKNYSKIIPTVVHKNNYDRTIRPTKLNLTATKNLVCTLYFKLADRASPLPAYLYY